MYNYPMSLTFSLIALILIVLGYFVRKKYLYLASQSLGIVFLILSYLFSEEYFAMISLSIGLFRTVTFFIYEKNNLSAPIIWSFIFSLATLVVYVVLELVVLQKKNFIGLINVVALSGYAFIFRMRNLNLVRYLVILPLGLSVLYNLLICAPIFTIISYLFEVTSSVVAIISFKIIEKRRKQQDLLD